MSTFVIIIEGSMKRKREPTTPGEILREEFLLPLGMTQKELADHIGCDVKVINRLVNGRTSVSAEMALRLGATFRTSPEFWLNAQKAVDLFRAENRVPDLPPPVLKAS
jgi:addiction module HigA family antidote